jgi:hypothetical protein
MPDRLLEHYDPLYQRALDRQTEARPPQQQLVLTDLTPKTLKHTAATLICENSSDFH